MSISNIIALLSGVALFLFGMSIMGDGLKRVAGNKLELVLYKLSSNPLKGILLGTGVTAVIQSSSATSVMVVGFVNTGMMKLHQASGIILGAILGTSITGWILCLSDIGGGAGWIELLSTATLTGVIAVAGTLLRMTSKDRTKTSIGDIFLGFAVLMFGMSAMSSAVSPLKDSPAFISMLTKFSNPLLGILIGTIFTAILQSASAAVGILQALAITGAIDFGMAMPIILGISIGAAVPVLVSAIGANVNAKRTAFMYLYISAIGVIAWAILFYGINIFVKFPFMSDTMNTVTIAGLNTLFRLFTVIILAPFTGFIDKSCTKFIKEKESHRDDDLLPLEERFIPHPALSIEQSRLAIDDMARRAQSNLLASMCLLENYSKEGFDEVEKMEDAVDRYEDRLGTYLMQIVGGRELTTRQNEDVTKFLHTISDFERISDHAVNIAKTALEIDEKKIVFSGGAAHELEIMRKAVTEILEISINAFIANDIGMAACVEPLEQIIDELCDEAKLHHIDRLQKGQCTLNHGFPFNDLITNYERIADHCSNIAVAIIELESNAFDTHEYLRGVKEMKNDVFASYIEEYGEKYKF